MGFSFIHALQAHHTKHLIAMGSLGTDLSRQMANAYSPKAVESSWYAWWEKAGYFKPALTADGKAKPEGTYVIPIPPPNVTGSLHLGHALTNAIQDAMIRW